MGVNPPIYNSMFALAAGLVQIWKFSFFFKFVIGLQFVASVPQPAQAGKTLALYKIEP